MSTLQQCSLFFNSKINISNDGGNLSSDAGLTLIQEFLHKINFDHLLSKSLSFSDTRKYCQHSMTSLAKQLLLQLIAGYRTDVAANRLVKEPVFTMVLSKEKLASQPTMSRFINSLTSETLFELHGLATTLNEIYFKQVNQQVMIIDIDSTHADTYGKQENTDYNGHYGTTGYHPLVAFDALSGLCLGAEQRAGNAYTSKDSESFLRPIIEKYRNYSCDMTLLVRGDSGFAKPEIYDVCEELHAQFLIRLKANTKLQSIAESLVLYGDNTHFPEEEVQWFELDNYQPSTWKKPYRVIIKSTRPAGELLFKHEFIVTNLKEASPEMAFKLYQKRGTMENFIKEIKLGFFFDKTDSSTFLSNSARMIFSCLAYNIIRLMVLLVFPENEKKSLIETIRFKLIHIAGKVTRHAGKIHLKLASTNVFDPLFWQVLFRIQHLELR